MMFRRLHLPDGSGRCWPRCSPADDEDDAQAQRRRPRRRAARRAGRDGDAPLPLGGARQVAEQTDLYLFEYSCPQAAGEITGAGALARQATGPGAQHAGRAARRTGAAKRGDNGFPFQQLFQRNRVGSGGRPARLAQPVGRSVQLFRRRASRITASTRMVWDKQDETSARADRLLRFAGKRWTRRSAATVRGAERGARRSGAGSRWQDDRDDAFDACVEAGRKRPCCSASSNGKTFDRIGIQIAPYVAGPYAEGSLRVRNSRSTPDLLEAVSRNIATAFIAS